MRCARPPAPSPFISRYAVVKPLRASYSWQGVGEVVCSDGYVLFFVRRAAVNVIVILGMHAQTGSDGFNPARSRRFFFVFFFWGGSMFKNSKIRKYLMVFNIFTV